MSIPQKKALVAKPFLGVQFISCSTYGRLYRNKDNTAYTGFCPKCGKSYRIKIGAEGTSARFFVAKCRG